MNFTSNHELDLAYNYVQFTNKNIFLTGKAGTGKTTFLHTLKDESPKRMIIVAPTGVAAINAGGVTIHSFFQIPFGPQIPRVYIENTDFFQKPQDNNKFSVKKLNRDKISIIKSLDLLVIDEISMVRADLLDAIDEVLRKFRNHNLAFGGVQLLMIGDLQQLAPVVKDDEWSILGQYYDTQYFFSSKAFQQTAGVNIELKHIYRQSDQVFISILNKIRENKIDPESLKELNKRYIPDFDEGDDKGYITLTTHNARAQSINEQKLNLLTEKVKTFKSEKEGEFPEYMYPTEEKLVLKKGAQVMFVKNDISKEKLFYNGKIGMVTDFGNDSVIVECPGDYSPIEVKKAEWDNTKYNIDKETKEITENIAGKFIQYPLKLAWAITIHKSQGLTFEKAIIDANASFAHGQVYVALSRCKTLEGMVLKTPIGINSIKCDQSVQHFTKAIEENPPNNDNLNESKRTYEYQLLSDLFNFENIQISVYSCIKELKSNGSLLLENPVEKFQNINPIIKNELSEVANKFKIQIKQLLSAESELNNNAALQDRIKKGSVYFLEKLQSNILQLLDNTTIETDNKSIKKDITKAYERLGQECLTKRMCLEAVKDGFNLQQYLEDRALANLEKYTFRKQQTKGGSGKVPESVENPELFALLKSWRHAKAEELDLPHYMILHQKALLELTKHKPSSPKQLKSINGMGKKKMEQFGDELLEIINDFCIDNNLEQPEPELELAGKEKKPKKEKIDTKKVSFDLYKEGKSIDEIAKERGLTNSTIEGHMAYYIAEGEIELSKVMDGDKITQITDYFIKNPTAGFSQAKENLGRNISYGEIKMVSAFMRIEG